jgi:uncharacterized membrane protein YukC
LIYHAHVNSIADYYNVEGLAKLSATKIQAILDKSWSADSFCALVEYTTGSTGDKSLRQVLAKAAVDNMIELMQKGFFSEEKIPHNLAVEVLKAAIGIFKDYIPQMRVVPGQRRRHVY